MEPAPRVTREVSNGASDLVSNAFCSSHHTSPDRFKDHFCARRSVLFQDTSLPHNSSRAPSERAAEHFWALKACSTRLRVCKVEATPCFCSRAAACLKPLPDRKMHLRPLQQRRNEHRRCCQPSNHFPHRQPFHGLSSEPEMTSKNVPPILRLFLHPRPQS